MQRILLTSKRVCGFTLVELMVTISLMAILISIATPSFTRLIENSRQKTTRDLLVRAINTAQQKAISRTVSVFLCPSMNGSSCESSWSEKSGWMVYQDLDRNGTPSDNEIVLVQLEVSIKKIVSTNNLLRFFPTGHSTANQFTICSNLDSEDDYRFNISRMGRVNYENPSSFCSS